MNYGFFKRFIILIAFFFGCFFAFNNVLEAGTFDADFRSNLSNAGVEPQNVKEVYFGNDLSAPNGSIIMDLSEEQDDSIKGYAVEDLIDGLYKVYVESATPIVFPEDSIFMFAYMENLEIIDFNNIDTSNVAKMNYMFIGLPSLVELDLSNFDTRSIDLDNSSYIFDDTLEVITLPANCNFRLPIGVWSVDGTDEKFLYNNINIDEATTFVKSSYYMGVKDDTLYISNNPIVGIPEEENMIYYEGTSIYSALPDEPNFHHVVVGGHNDVIQLMSMEYMFVELDSLESINLVNVDTSNLQVIEGAFAGLGSASFEYIDLSNINTRNVNQNDAPFIENNFSSIKVGVNWTLGFDQWKWKNQAGELFEHNEIPPYVEDTYTAQKSYWGLNETTHTLYISNHQRPEEKHGKIDLEYQTVIVAVSDQLESEGYDELPLIQHVVVGTSSEDVIVAKKLSHVFNALPDVISYDFTYLDTSKTTNMTGMFVGNTSLETLDLSGFDTSNVEHMSNMFSGCSSLVSLNLSGFNTEKVKDMAYMFYGCESLISLNLSGFNTEKVESMENMFSGCSSLTSLNLNSFTTEAVTEMQYMFNGCSALSNLNISSFRTQNVENMSYMFNDCQSLTTIDVSNFNTESVNDISRMFYGTGIQSLDLRSFNTSGFEYYEDYLSLNTTAVTLGVNWNIGLDSGLWRNTAGQEYNYNEIPQNVEDTYYRVSLFWGINTDTHTLYISGQPVTGENFVSGTINKDGSFSEDWSPWALTEEDILYVVVGTSNTDIVRPTYMTKWFALLKYAVSFDFTYLNTENVINMSQLFYDCESVETLDLRRFNTAKVTTMEGMFKNCYNLSNLDVSSFNTSNVRSINDMFLSTSSLESLNISNFDLSKVALKDDVFSASGIRLISVSSTFNGIELPEGDYEDISTGMLYAYNELPQNKAATYKMKVLYYSINNGVLRISNNELTTGIYGTASARGTETPWTNENDQITKVIVGEDGNKVKPLSTANWFLYLENVSLFDLKNLDTSNVVDMSSMFEGCTSMTTIDVSNFNTSKVEDMTSMFSDTGLTSIDLSKLDFSKVEYTIAMFENSSNLTSVNLGNPNTSNLIDARYMFTNCSSLESFDLSALDTSSLQTFASMFAGCVSLKEMDLRNVDFSASDDINAMFAGCENLEIVRLSDFSQFVIDNEAGYPDDYIFGECPKLNILVTKGFNEEIDYEGADISIYDANHNKRTSGRIRTGDYILADSSDEGETIEIPIIIMGDVTKDGLVNISDVMKIATHIIKKNIIKTNAERIAANVIRSNTSNVLETQDKDINISDVMKIATYIIKGGVLE